MADFFHEKGVAFLEKGDKMPDYETKWWTKERLAELEKEGYFGKPKNGQREVKKEFRIKVGGELVATPTVNEVSSEQGSEDS